MAEVVSLPLIGYREEGALNRHGAVAVIGERGNSVDNRRRS
jgi:hypothetical protein